MKNFKNWVLLLTATAALGLTSCKKDSPEAPPTPLPPTASVGLLFEHAADMPGDTADLVLNTGRYTTAAGDDFQVKVLKYYISNLQFFRADGSSYAVPNAYFLVDAGQPGSNRIELSGIPLGTYSRVSFVVGVDSARNVSGAQTGALDPVHDMFWGWDQGYVYLRLQGTSPQAVRPANPTGALDFSVSGFHTPHNAIRTVSLAMAPDNLLPVRTGHSPEIHLHADILKLFAGAKTVRFGPTTDPASVTLVATGPGTNSVIVANNYADPGGGHVLGRTRSPQLK